MKKVTKGTITKTCMYKVPVSSIYKFLKQGSQKVFRDQAAGDETFSLASCHQQPPCPSIIMCATLEPP